MLIGFKRFVLTNAVNNSGDNVLVCVDIDKAFVELVEFKSPNFHSCRRGAFDDVLGCFDVDVAARAVGAVWNLLFLRPVVKTFIDATAVCRVFGNPPSSLKR